MALAKSLSFERDPVLFRTNKIVWESYARKRRNYRSDRTRRALVVDDDEVFQEYVKKLLESLFSSVRVEVASDLASACEKIRESIRAGKRYGFILCDVHLNSSNDGIEFWKYCTLVLDLNVPFAFISALPIDQVYEVLSHLGKSPPMITKPFTVRELSLLVENLLNSEFIEESYSLEELTRYCA